MSLEICIYGVDFSKTDSTAYQSVKNLFRILWDILRINTYLKATCLERQNITRKKSDFKPCKKPNCIIKAQNQFEFGI